MTWLDTAGAAEYVKRNADEVRRMAKSGQIPAHPTQSVQREDRPAKGRPHYRYDTTELDAWMRGDTVTPRPITTRPRKRAS